LSETLEIVDALDRGELRVAEKVDGEWQVNEAAKAAILDYFRIRQVEPIEVGPYHYVDKIPLKTNYADLGVRVVPPATARYGSYLSRGVVMMPSYVNIGAWVGPNSMVDTWRRSARARRSAPTSTSPAASGSAACSSPCRRAP
jgi:2,3,4,5-tetrahydropyridine-2-carboxylate N-succinyltransferase